MTRQALTLVSHLLCPYVQRAAIALNEKDVPFERVVIDLANKPQWFLDISPLGKVPLLKVQRPDGSEAVLFESNVICEYLEETQPGARLHPEDPLTRAEHRAWMEFGSAILADLWGYETTQDAAVFEQKRLALIAKFGRVEAALGEGPYFAGAQLQPGRCGLRAGVPLLRGIRRDQRLARLRCPAQGRCLAQGAGRPSQRAQRRGA